MPPPIESARPQVGGPWGRGPHGPGAFSLLELLVAMAVLSLLLICLSQMVGSVSNLYKMGMARSAANGVGRALLDTMTGDLRQAIIRPDLKTFVEQDTGNIRTLRFYCLRPGDFRGSTPTGGGLEAARPASIVEYVFYRSGSKQAYLARRDKPCSWNSSVIPLGQTNTIQDLDANTEESLIYEGIVGLDWNYLLADGSMTDQLASANGTNPLVAIRYSMALLDADGMRLLKEAGKVGNFIQMFSGVGGIAAWESNLQANASAYPPKVISGTRFYERSVTLPQSAN